MKKLI
jgi:hypothetical protein